MAKQTKTQRAKSARDRRAARKSERARAAADLDLARAKSDADAKEKAERRAKAEREANDAIIVAAKTCVQEWLKEPRNDFDMRLAHAELIRAVLNRRALTGPLPTLRVQP